jgi:hypothetical protein
MASMCKPFDRLLGIDVPHSRGADILAGPTFGSRALLYIRQHRLTSIINAEACPSHEDDTFWILSGLTIFRETAAVAIREGSYVSH